MPWDITDYNLNKLGNKSNKEINAEYNRIKKMIQKRVKTFERHGVTTARHINAIKETMRGNDSRRDRERAIMEMRRFINMDTSTYRGYIKARQAGLETWRGFGAENLTGENIELFFDFLEWVKSFSGGKYEINSVIQAWNMSGKDVTKAQSLFDSMINEK